ncbi:MAG TPA: thiamine pyrophosphate-dependent enzyme [Verrucomicrobiae bacterium]|nr:thiamine pyrophosphate-dependent enzyme [Verrucomicrobiae bacterium]
MNAGQLAGFLHLYAGQEAVAVGVCAHLSDRDWVASTHRGHSHAITLEAPAAVTDAICGQLAAG